MIRTFRLMGTLLNIHWKNIRSIFSFFLFFIFLAEQVFYECNC